VCADASPLLCPALPVVARLGDRGDRASVVNTSDDATVYGEDGNDDILSSGFAGLAYGGAGDDRVRVNSNSQASGYGGTGDDTIRAGSVANAAAFGESGNDVLIHEPSVQALLDGGAGRDVLIGLPNGFGPLEAHGGAGTDILAIQSTGGSGRVARWALSGDAGNDLIAGGPGADTIDGGTGGDAIYSAGGGADTVTCGSGFDVVRADADDTVGADCELRYVAPAASIPSPITSALRAARR
jgi:Ca2+-binding RTX toxin-like protein